MAKNNNTNALHCMNTFSKAELIDPIVIKKVLELIDNGSEIDRINLKEKLYEVSSQIKDVVNDPLYIICDIFKIVK